MHPIIVAGGGAAGFFAAIVAASHGAQVIILEKGSEVLSKVRISGGGRCNVTNIVSDPLTLASYYPRGGRELVGAFTRFGTSETRQWFTDRGVELKTESDGRVFPSSDSSQTIIDCLQQEAKRLGVITMLRTGITEIMIRDNGFIIQTNTGPFEASKVIIATGGGASFEVIAKTGHTMMPPVPSLFTFKIPDSPFAGLEGVVVDDATVSVPGTRLSENGPMLITHQGLSGPAVLRLSAFGARYFNERKYEVEISLRMIPQERDHMALEHLKQWREQNLPKKVINAGLPLLPRRLWERLCSLSGITPELRWADAGKAPLHRLAGQLFDFRLWMRGRAANREEFVTCGGVSLKEIDMKTMESRLVPGLFFAGEVLDIDGVTGGFNFQAAWTTGWLAGMNA